MSFGEISIVEGLSERHIAFVLCCHCEATIPCTTKHGVTHYFTPYHCSRCNKPQCERCAALPCNPIDGRIEQALRVGGRIADQVFTYRILP